MELFEFAVKKSLKLSTLLIEKVRPFKKGFFFIKS